MCLLWLEGSNVIGSLIGINVHCSSSQVKIFEEDFRKERSDRERMNEEKEDLRRQVERLQGQMTNLTNQVGARGIEMPSLEPPPHLLRVAYTSAVSSQVISVVRE